MKIALVLCGTLNSFYRNFKSEKDTIFKLFDELNLNYDVFACLENRSYFKKSTPAIAKEFVSENKFIDDWEILFSYQDYVVCEKKQDLIKEELNEVFKDKVKNLCFKNHEIEKYKIRHERFAPNPDIMYAYHAKQVLGALSVLNEEKNNNKIYDTFVFCRPDGAFNEKPDENKINLILKNLKECSESNEKCVVVDSNYSKVKSHIDYKFVRINGHAPIITSRAGIFPKMELETLYKYEFIKYFRPTEINNVNIWLDTLEWKIHIFPKEVVKNSTPTFRPIHYDAETISGEFFKAKYDKILFCHYKMGPVR